jgi:hypothetical protein
MDLIKVLLLVFGFVLVFLAGAGVPNPPSRWSFGWLGLACVIMVLIIDSASGLHMGSLH